MRWTLALSSVLLVLYLHAAGALVASRGDLRRVSDQQRSCVSRLADADAVINGALPPLRGWEGFGRKRPT